MKKLNSEVYKVDDVNDFRELLNRSAKKYPDHVAYEFKENLDRKSTRLNSSHTS